MIIRSKAPLRISFAGGGTDVPPYPEEKGGVVLNCTINKYAYASLEPIQEDRTIIESLDFDLIAKYNLDSDLLYNGELDLVKSVIKNMGGTKGHKLFIHCDAPPGSGLGSSSTMTVAMIGAFQRWLNKPMTDYDIAEKAYFIEREDLHCDDVWIAFDNLALPGDMRFDGNRRTWMSTQVLLVQAEHVPERIDRLVESQQVIGDVHVVVVVDPLR